ncbi:dCMP deaminase [Hydrogenispora ethanolica]|jgi:dCMP deaminase|uniref:dCMP deaminase n=1 Tax=Hydrogenispora ethanolica TaxID=1082276 RepID=A0A4R1S1A1_HYDET|nr:dCMP deaminase family protein [Hydrogenispora ethanolica]TCL72320.1 dCMP deaminase [Hydrogenispora ethanolica]
MRPSKEEYYLNIASQVAERGTCLRRKFGAVIVNNDQIISTGYVGAPRGTINCCDLERCPREAAGIPPGERYELCRSVHAEANAIIHADRLEMIGATLYLACIDAKTGEFTPGTKPCRMCTRLIINAGIEKVVVREAAGRCTEYLVANWVWEENLNLSDARGY